MPRTPFDAHADRANEEGYHNHRVNTHSDLISLLIGEDLYEKCPALRRDLDAGTIGWWVNRKNPWGRNRNTDLIVAEPLGELPEKRPSKLGKLGAASLGLQPNNKAVRLVCEHKSIVTAHRNRSARHDDLDHLYQDANSKSPTTIVAATIMVGTAEWYLNVADRVKDHFSVWKRDASGKRLAKVVQESRFERDVLPRLRAHDETLMDTYIAAVSGNSPRDIEASFELFQGELPVRPSGDRSKSGFDAFLTVPVHYDNIRPARVDRGGPYPKQFKLDPDRDYAAFLTRICETYRALYDANPTSTRVK